MKRLILILAALVACGASSSTLAQLDATETEDLLFMREEEKLARDTYLTLYDRWSQNIFQNIARSEQRHMDTMLDMIQYYGLEDPVTDDTVGAFNNPVLATLYDDLIERGSASLLEALHVGAYIEDAMTFGDWSVIGALRADRYDLDAKRDPMYEADYPFAEIASISDSEVSPKLGLVWRPRDSVDLYLQYSHGFRAPPYEDANIGLELPVFNVRAIPNPDLRSETSDGVDLGVRWRGERGSLHLSLFRTDYNDFIESKVRLGPDPDTGRILFQSQNVQEAVIEGVEAGWSVEVDRMPGEFSLDGSFYWARGENRDNGQPLNSVGPAQAVIGIDWATTDGNWHTRLRATFTDGWSDLDESGGELFKPPGHAVFDLYVTRDLGDRVRLRGGVTNLADKTYWSWSDVRGLGPTDPVIPYLARPGRSLVLGVDMDW